MKNILEYLEQNAAKYPDKIIFSDIKNSVTYNDFLTRCKQIGCSLLNTRNNCVAVFDNRDVNTFISCFGVLYSGNYYADLDSQSPVERLQKIIDTVQPVAIICDESNREILKNLNLNCKILFIKEILENTEIDEQSLISVRDKMISTDPIYALFTSGSTGTPKGTILTHINVISYIEWYVKAMQIDENTIFASQHPFYFSASVSDVFGTIVTGATLHIIPKSYFSFPIYLVDFMNKNKVNAIYWVPSALNIIANIDLFKYAKFDYLNKIMFAGEIMPNKQLNYWRKHFPNATFANLFGPTETTDICTYYVVDREFKDDESLPIGKHCDNCDTFIVDENDKLVTEVGVIGELLVRSPFVASGYYDNPEKTNSAFVQNPLHNHYPEKVYRTGDLVKINEFGEYLYAGRKDFQIKHLGYRIELGEIETAAMAIEKVNNVVCLYNSEKDLIILIYEGKVNQNDIIEQLKSKVPYYMVPNVTINIKQMPYNANGKIDRTWLNKNYETLIKKED